MKKIGKDGLKLIKEFEGCKLKAYRCPAGVLTIGWGHTAGVQEDQEISQEQADQLLVDDLEDYVTCVNKVVHVEIDQCKFDALVSLCYNIGTSALEYSSAVRYLNLGDINRAAEGIKLWNRGGGVVLRGLVRRRQAEADLFLHKPCKHIEEKEVIIDDQINICEDDDCKECE